MPKKRLTSGIWNDSGACARTNGVQSETTGSQPREPCHNRGDFPGWPRIDPNFDPPRKNPRFQKLMAGGR